MSAGLPGFGLGGLFFVICALLAPIPELVRTARGTSSAGAWRRVMRQFAVAVTMVAVFELTRRALGGMISGEVELRGIAVTVVVLAAVLGAAKALELALLLRRRLTGRRSSAPVPGRYSPPSRLASESES